jgi:hypothetical protein
LRPSKKLAHRFLGPYVGERRVGANAYRLRLPKSMGRLHPVFPVVKLLTAPLDPIPGRWSSSSSPLFTAPNTPSSSKRNSEDP